MAYYAYENWHRRRARVHVEGCGHLALERIGKQDIGALDRWHDLGEFDTAGEAMAEALRRFEPGNDYGDVDFCGHCLG